MSITDRGVRTWRVRVLMAAVLLPAAGAAVVRAADFTWAGNTGNWSAGSSWVGSLIPTGGGFDTLHFTGANPFTASNDLLVGTTLPAVYLNRMTVGGAGDATTNGPTASLPLQSNLRFGGPSPSLEFSGAGAKTFFNVINVGWGATVNAVVAADSGPVTFGDAALDAGAFVTGNGTLVITNNSANTVLIGNLEERTQGTLRLEGGAFEAARTTGNLFGDRVTIHVGAGASFNVNGNGEDMGVVVGSGMVLLGGASLNFRTEGDHLFSGSFQGAGGVTARQGRAGAGTTTWTGDNTHSGATAADAGTLRLADGGRVSQTSAMNIRHGAALVLDNTGTVNDNDRVRNAATVSLGGSLTLLGRADTATTETMGALTLANTGAAVITATPGGGTGTAGLTFASLAARNARGQFVEFAGAGTVNFTAAPALNNGVLLRSVTGSDWATITAGQVTPFAAYQTDADPVNWLATDNVSVGGPLGGSAFIGTRTINSLKLASADTIDVGAVQTLTLATGGILATANATLVNGSIVGNQAGSNDEVQVHVTAGNTLTIQSTIADTPVNGLLKTGAGTLVLTGFNTYSGGTMVHGGVLEVSSDNNLGVTTTLTLQVVNAGLRFTESVTLDGRQLTLGGRGNTIEVVADKVVAFTRAPSGDTAPGNETAIRDNGDSGGFIKTGAGTLIGNAGSLDGPITVQAGIFRTPGNGVGTAGDAISNRTLITVAAGAVFDDSFGNGEDFGSLAGAGDVHYRDAASGSLRLFNDPMVPFDTVFSGRIRSFLNGTISSSGSNHVFFGSGSATVGHGGRITLSGASDYAGRTEINYGEVRVTADVLPGQNGPLGNPTLSNLPILIGNATNGSDTNAALLIGAAGVTIGRDITVRDSATAGQALGIITLGSDHAAGTSTVSGNITLNRAIQITVAGDALTRFTGTIGGTGTIVKVGSGTASLAADAGNSYFGVTHVAEGTLLLDNASGSATIADIHVHAGGTLGGAGRSDGQVFVHEGGTLAPGNSPGIITVGRLIGEVGGVLRLELDGNTAGAGYDQVVVLLEAGVQLEGMTLDATLGYTPDPTDVLTIVDNQGLAPVFGTFAGLAEGAQVGLGLFTADISYVGGDGNDVTLSNFAPIPEPGTWAMLVTGAVIGGVWLRRRRRATSPVATAGA